MRIETRDDSIIIYGSIIGTVFDECDQRTIIKWFLTNKAKMVKQCKKELSTLEKIKKLEVPME